MIKITLPKNENGVIHLLAILLIIVIISAVSALVFFGFISNPFKKVTDKFSGKTSSQPTVALKEDYKNPFDKESQYVNPFDQYKSPLLNLKK